MTKKIAVLAAVAMFILGLMAFAADANFGVGKTRTVTFIGETKVGNTVLPAGEYRVQHIMEGENHIMVFKSSDTNKEKARVKCSMSKLDKKADQTQAMINSADNQRVLTGLVFAGDDYSHNF